MPFRPAGQVSRRFALFDGGFDGALDAWLVSPKLERSDLAAFFVILSSMTNWRL